MAAIPIFYYFNSLSRTTRAVGLLRVLTFHDPKENFMFLCFSRRCKICPIRGHFEGFVVPVLELLNPNGFYASTLY